MTLYDTVMVPLFHQQRKHGLGPTWAEDMIDKLTPLEFLKVISEALDNLPSDGSKAPTVSSGGCPPPLAHKEAP